jgi:NTP pyrophosphatase (non-canonical NTP hydrolase)
MSYPTYDLTIKKLFDESAKRAERWHQPDGIHSWSPLEWAGAMCGEAGETANVAKKLKRLTDGIVSLNSVEEDRHYTDIETAKKKCVKEACDTILYALVLIHVCDGDAEEALREVFNQKSIECGFPERV